MAAVPDASCAGLRLVKPDPSPRKKLAATLPLTVWLPVKLLLPDSNAKPELSDSISWSDKARLKNLIWSISALVRSPHPDCFPMKGGSEVVGIGPDHDSNLSSRG